MSAFGASLLIHAVLGAALLLSLRVLQPGPSPPPILIELTAAHRPLEPSPHHRHGRLGARGRVPPPPPAIARPAPSAPLPLAAPDPGLAGLRAALRAGVGCSESAFLKLTAAERAACARRAFADPGAAGALPLNIDPDKLARWDAAHAEDIAPPLAPIVPCEGPGFNFGFGCPNHALGHKKSF